MARVKWDQMTDESQAMVKKVGLISVGGVILLAFSKMIFPLVMLGGGSYVAWRSLFRSGSWGTWTWETAGPRGVTRRSRRDAFTASLGPTPFPEPCPLLNQ